MTFSPFAKQSVEIRNQTRAGSCFNGSSLRDGLDLRETCRKADSNAVRKTEQGLVNSQTGKSTCPSHSEHHFTPLSIKLIAALFAVVTIALILKWGVRIAGN